MEQIHEIGAPGVASNEIFFGHRDVAIFFCLGCHVGLLMLLLSSFSLAAMISRILGFDTFPDVVAGSSRTSSIRSGHLNFANPSAARCVLMVFNVGSSAPARGTIKAHMRSPY